jgi:hypothetical protein
MGTQGQYKGERTMGNDKPHNPPEEDQVVRVLTLFGKVKDPYQRGKIIGKLEAYAEQAETHPINTEQTA